MFISIYFKMDKILGNFSSLTTFTPRFLKIKMKKSIILFVGLFISIIVNSQTLQSPEQFLGYKIGTKFTPHYKIVSYVKALAQAKPDVIKVEKYGETYEGRELLLAYISSPENIRNLESIRRNNLALTGISKSTSQINNAPAIVWLSYNVHGNETSSSEAAMLTLYTLVDPANTKSTEWLTNTVVIIDPCINPDGRDRYVNWFNSVAGKNFNYDPQAREHSEPWPGGRTNHYNFDLNRDWAWQTQKETQQRMAKYNEWLPQIHVDFHEQSVDAPYYFAPAAEPLHEVITPWQREFQNTIGKSNAKYFDEKGWLYFTKERFDLFYPSYGDTYPIYNGAIGMTYEQGGGPRGGLGIVSSNGDSLTLIDRVTHHYTTSLSTIEVASKNASRLVSEYKKFFDNSSNAVASDYKTYVLTSDDEGKIASVKNLLDKNQIVYGTLSGRVKGYHYFTGKEEEAPLQKYTLAISAYQPKSTLVKVLFEPKGKLTDSLTYDITAWSVPYSFGVDAFALKDKRNVSTYPHSDAAITRVTSSYGILLPYTSVNSAMVLAYLLKKGVKVRMAEKPFTYNNKVYDRGTLIVIRTSNSGNWLNAVNEAATKFNIQPIEVASGFVEKGADFGSSDVRMIKAPKVALITGEQTNSLAAGEVWHFFDQTLDYPLTLISASELSRVNLASYNVIILPDGRYRSLNDKSVTDKLKEFVKQGGSLIAMQGAVEQLASADWGIRLREFKDDKTSSDNYDLLKKYGERERTNVDPMPGAIYKVTLDNTHPLAFGYPEYYYTLRQDKNVYDFMAEGWNVGVIKKNSLVAGFVGYELKSKMKDGMLFGVQDMGNGSVIYFADDPLFRLFWENGKLMFANAVFMVGQ
jgi:hypothetical protein